MVRLAAPVKYLEKVIFAGCPWKMHATPSEPLIMGRFLLSLFS
jgi:hypothetical protein